MSGKAFSSHGPTARGREVRELAEHVAKTAIAYHEKYAQYDLGPGHPFRGDRFPRTWEFFKRMGLLDRPEVRVVRPEPVGRETLLLVHDERYVDLIFRLSEHSRPYDWETPCSPGILEALLYIIGGVLTVGSEVAEGRVEKGVALGGGFHHAARSRGGGFCLFNDVAILAEYLRKHHGLERIMIVDHDVHAGDGTSEIFYADPGVLLVSIHQDPRTIYPGTGFIHQVGEGPGEGYNVNVPLPPGTGDGGYLRVLEEVVAPLAREFRPDFLISNGGSDPHFMDLLGSLLITAKGFHAITSFLTRLADEVCGGRYTVLIGSGYNPSVLPRCWYALAAGAMRLGPEGLEEPRSPPPESEAVRRAVDKVIRDVKKALSPYWSCFRS